MLPNNKTPSASEIAKIKSNANSSTGNLNHSEFNEASLKSRIISKSKKKLRKFRRDPKLFLVDSRAFIKTQKTLYFTWAKLGSFILVLLASLLVVIYYSVIASPRYTSQVQFVVKQADGNDLQISGLAALGGASSNTRDALIIQEFIRSSEMVKALDEQIALALHYQNEKWDFLSRLKPDTTKEELLKFYQAHISVKYDELSEILLVEVQSFDAEYSLIFAQTLLEVSEQFINQLGEGMANQQLKFAENQVNRAHELLKVQQMRVLKFQDEHQLLSPEAQSSALLTAIHQLEADVIAQQAELKSMQAYMQSDSAEIRARQYRIEALTQQLTEERKKLTSKAQTSLNKLGANFKEIELNVQLAADLYASSLTSLELVRADAFKNLKHLLIIEYPKLAEEDTYPKRLHSIITWFVALLLIYFVGRLLIAVVKEHKD